jgi:hypothetical protein
MTRGEEYLRALGVTLLVVVSIFAAPVIIAGCCDKQQAQPPAAPATLFEDGQVWVRYRVVTVEGRRWLAYLGHNGWWHLAGPIDDNTPEPLPAAFDVKPNAESP